MALSTTSFATKDQMEQRSQGAIPATTPFLDQELAAATRTIRNHCRWHIAAVEQLTFRRSGPFAEPVWLPAMQIATLDEITIDGVAIDPAGVEFDFDTGWTSLCGRIRQVKFTAGFEEIPEDLVTLTLELAAGALGSPLGISREQAGGVSVSYTRTSGALQPADEDRLAAYRLGWLP
ncbi:hypothetical protein [Microbacterium sp. 8M]|uniref:hypothetical protein n=1 Tax=Microbacterium sp. 8M TaxID=2653153 RepID=UPI00135AA07E|nr:hypothetical protein [Microbacterium sp. 8M]